MRVFLLDRTFSGETVYTLKKREIQYLEKVLRLDEGTVFTAKDVNENYYRATIGDSGNLFLEPTENPEETLLDALSGYRSPFAPIDMYVSILKGKKNEAVVRSLTETGVRRIIFVRSEYCQEKDFSPHDRERLNVILSEAVQQCGGKAPSLEGPEDFDSALGKAEGMILLLHQSLRGKTLSLREINFEKDTVVSCFIGPEGGFSENECERAEEKGAVPVLLRTNILRAETSSLYTVAALQTILH